MNKLKTLIVAGGLLMLPLAAHAYIGPGAGLSLLGALWAFIVAIATAVFFVIAWPVRRMRRRKREAKEREARERAGKSEPEPPRATDTERVAPGNDPRHDQPAGRAQPR